ncbi:MAG: Hsp20/alpha crystallin family protein [Planctomycetes bacterium]|nr:Hsp20/alpha crystallin family protein [Planctomycetota bacterium]
MSTAISQSGTRPEKPRVRPFEMLRQEFDDLFGRLANNWDAHWLARDFEAACDVSETADAFQLRMDLPGIKPQDLVVQVTGDTVHISGERKEESDEKGKTYHRMERRSGKFEETVRLPAPVHDDQVQAEYHAGVLTVTLPKTRASTLRTVKVQTAEK